MHSTSTMPPMKLAVSKPGGRNSGLPVSGALVVVVPGGRGNRRFGELQVCWHPWVQMCPPKRGDLGSVRIPVAAQGGLVAPSLGWDVPTNTWMLGWAQPLPMPEQLELQERSQWQTDPSGINNSAGSGLRLLAVMSPALSSSHSWKRLLLHSQPGWRWQFPARMESGLVPGGLLGVMSPLALPGHCPGQREATGTEL